MSVSGIVTSIAGTAVSAVTHPFGTAKKVAGTGLTTAEAVAHTVADRLRQRQGKPLSDDEIQEDPGHSSPEDKQSNLKAVPDAEESSGDEAQDRAAPEIIPPSPPAEPPVNVVEQVLAAEEKQARQPRAGRATEPRGASRDEEHGEAALQRAEAEEIAEEAVEGTPAGEVTVETPVGTTGADVGFNPDTAEADLQQPGTEPLVDAGTAKSIRSESEILTKAADPDKA